MTYEYNYEITADGIAIFDGFFSQKFCKELIDYFDVREKNGYVDIRQLTQDVPKDEVTDKPLYLDYGKFVIESEIRILSQGFLKIFWDQCYKIYANEFFYLKSLAQHKIYHKKIQKTSPGQGYHVWHSEIGNRETCNRVLVFILYLNDVEEGGETEFLHQRKRINPKTGRLVIWPTCFTHIHRGNPPLTDDKYILTGWVEF